jgi:hypothetical protein
MITNHKILMTVEDSNMKKEAQENRENKVSATLLKIKSKESFIWE